MDMFDAMIDSIREDTVRMLFTIQVRTNNAPKREEVLKAPTHHNMTLRRSNKVGRNDPCPCGSGKKYKNCCGAVNGENANPAENKTEENTEE